MPDADRHTTAVALLPHPDITTAPILRFPYITIDSCITHLFHRRTSRQR